MNCVLPLCAIAKKVLSYVTSHDDRGSYRNLHTAWVQAMYVPRNTQSLKLVSLVYTDIALEHGRPKSQAWVTKLCD
jgi:hypothetical protein